MNIGIKEISDLGGNMRCKQMLEGDQKMLLCCAYPDLQCIALLQHTFVANMFPY